MPLLASKYSTEKSLQKHAALSLQQARQGLSFYISGSTFTDQQKTVHVAGGSRTEITTQTVKTGVQTKWQQGGKTEKTVTQTEHTKRTVMVDNKVAHEEEFSVVSGDSKVKLGHKGMVADICITIYAFYFFLIKGLNYVKKNNYTIDYNLYVITK